jgi:biotin transport system substrate-specific component
MDKSSRDKLRRIVYSSMFGALTAIGSLIIIPIQPLPITLQTLFTDLAGVLLGGYTGALSQVIYVLLGIMGLPVFAGGKAGLGTLFGPTGGYLIGFILGAYMIGKMMAIKKDPGLAWTVLALAMGNVVIYTLGTVQFAWVAHISITKALLVGMVPFLPGTCSRLRLRPGSVSSCARTT